MDAECVHIFHRRIQSTATEGAEGIYIKKDATLIEHTVKRRLEEGGRYISDIDPNWKGRLLLRHWG